MFAMSPQEALTHCPPQSVETALGAIQYRVAGDAPQVTHVLLHGIGSGAASWAYQLEAARGRSDLRVVAWDAPGYGRSAPVLPDSPVARDYGERVWAWLDALGSTQPVVLVGHSLGCLMAAAATVLHPERVRRLVLLSPARGYGDASAQERADKLNSRLATLNRLGPQGMADARAAAMLSPAVAPELVAAVRETMSQVIPAGYTQATHLLNNGTLCRDVAVLTCPITVASGEADTITPPASCSQVAQAAGQERVSLGEVGHACPLEAGLSVNALLGLTRQTETEATR